MSFFPSCVGVCVSISGRWDSTVAELRLDVVGCTSAANFRPCGLGRATDVAAPAGGSGGAGKRLHPLRKRIRYGGRVRNGPNRRRHQKLSGAGSGSRADVQSGVGPENRPIVRAASRFRFRLLPEVSGVLRRYSVGIGNGSSAYGPMPDQNSVPLSFGAVKPKCR